MAFAGSGWVSMKTPSQPAATAARATQPLTYPVAFALAVASGMAGERDALLAFAFGWAENMMQAAIKSVPLGQASGQRILQRLAADPAARLGIIVPDLAGCRALLQDTLDDVLQPSALCAEQAEAPRPYNISLGVPLPRYPLVVLAFELLR